MGDIIDLLHDAGGALHDSNPRMGGPFLHGVHPLPHAAGIDEVDPFEVDDDVFRKVEERVLEIGVLVDNAAQGEESSAPVISSLDFQLSVHRDPFSSGTVDMKIVEGMMPPLQFTDRKPRVD